MCNAGKLSIWFYDNALRRYETDRFSCRKEILNNVGYRESALSRVQKRQRAGLSVFFR